MEIIETERMYVRDLRMIVEVSHMTTDGDVHWLVNTGMMMLRTP